MLGRRLGTVLFGTCLALVLASLPAHAHHNVLIAPDNANQAVYRVSLTSAASTATSHGSAQLNRSQINTSWGGGDIYVYDANMPDSWFGQAVCVERDTWGDCDIHHVTYNLRAMSGRSASNWRSLACHELGHTGSLAHRRAADDADDNSCMRPEIWPERLDSVDIEHINRLDL
jgi:hypothetical protein